MAANNPKLGASTGPSLVTVSDWVACYNKADDIIALSCTIRTNDSSATITGVGLILNNEKGITVGSFYTALSNGCEFVNPSINLPPGGLQEGETVWGVASGEVHKQHYFFEEKLTLGSC
jgi:hypothetical protein